MILHNDIAFSSYMAFYFYQLVFPASPSPAYHAFARLQVLVAKRQRRLSRLSQ